MKREDIKIGTFVWWNHIGNSVNQKFYSPGIISKVSETGFKIVTFDNMEEVQEEIPFSSEILINEGGMQEVDDETPYSSKKHSDELVVIPQKEALLFHQEKIYNLKAYIAKLKKELQEAEDFLKEHSRKSNIHCQSETLSPFLQGFETA